MFKLFDKVNNNDVYIFRRSLYAVQNTKKGEKISAHSI